MHALNTLLERIAEALDKQNQLTAQRYAQVSVVEQEHLEFRRKEWAAAEARDRENAAFDKIREERDVRIETQWKARVTQLETEKQEMLSAITSLTEIIAGAERP